MNNEIPDWLGSYLAKRDMERVARTEQLLSSFTQRERDLLREAATMGYVLGLRAPQMASVPHDQAILRKVVAACLDHSDLYPTVAVGGDDNG